MKALVVDDDEGIRWILDRVLQEEGVEVLLAGSIGEAKIILTDKAHSDINITFLDVYLPMAMAWIISPKAISPCR